MGLEEFRFFMNVFSSEIKICGGAISGKPLNKRKLISTDADKKVKNEEISVRRCKLETC